MNYNISTMFIWQFFNEDNLCPMCELRRKTEHDLVDQYLNEAVMEDINRGEVNKYGFCEKHFSLLYEGRNKLGLALQMNTRINYLQKIITKTKNSKEALKQGEKLEEATCSCIICRKIEFNMKRYFETTCALYGNEEKFRTTFKKIRGFCIPDYTRLMKNSKYAKKQEEELLSDMFNLESNYLESLQKNLLEFTSAFDYHSTSTPSKEASSSLKEAEIKVYGQKPLPPSKK